LLSVELLSIEGKRLVSRLKVYTRYTYSFNMYSLRYAFIIMPRLHINLYIGGDSRGEY
jgi:hypothetical protein